MVKVITLPFVAELAIKYFCFIFHADSDIYTIGTTFDISIA
ncbi:Uncharacterized protein YR821_1801 [Yersinia ruckeri]|uniref:Uncharacterized protein n=1 Tax=Yersinia ruckeri TaxID=29486 RepID=A0A0A8VJ47_YERRU|nr:hypothetical protein yruck0001_13240 [Yersinia ruckeri ATCC 29473]QTD76723.1 Uncharacterized protein YR821_1801 [Yersinia ruckeri]CEK27621.1 hypothetical protein CSF007_9340 [Yersinia ruckeri]